MFFSTFPRLSTVFLGQLQVPRFGCLDLLTCLYPWPLLLSVLPAAPGLVFLELGLIWLLQALGRRGDR